MDECPQGGKHDPTTFEQKTGDGVHIKWTACKKCHQRLS